MIMNSFQQRPMEAIVLAWDFGIRQTRASGRPLQVERVQGFTDRWMLG